jgi:hypothetical protein
VDFVTPHKWYRFFGRQIGRTTIGMAAALCPSAFYFGLELITGKSKGVGFVIGPLWIGFGVLTPPHPGGNND